MFWCYNYMQATNCVWSLHTYNSISHVLDNRTTTQLNSSICQALPKCYKNWNFHQVLGENKCFLCSLCLHTNHRPCPSATRQPIRKQHLSFWSTLVWLGKSYNSSCHKAIPTCAAVAKCFLNRVVVRFCGFFMLAAVATLCKTLKK